MQAALRVALHRPRHLLRAERGFDHGAIALSIGVQRIVRSDLGASGVMFSIDAESGFRDAVLINASYGLGENVVQGSVTPDEYYVFKPTLALGFRSILRKRAGTKEFKLVYDIGGSKGVKNVPVPAADRVRFAVGDDHILTLARWACLIEDHYSTKRGCRRRWTWSGRRMGARAISSSCRRDLRRCRRSSVVTSSRRIALTARGPLLATGPSVGEKIGEGRGT